MYESPQKKNSSWTPSTVQKKGKSPSKLGHFSIQPKPNQSSESSQEIGEYSRTSMDRLAANVMRSLQTREQEIAEESIQPKFQSPWAPTFEPPPPLPESPASQLKGAFAPVSENPIQRQCAECAKEEEEQKGEERKDLDEIGIQTKLTVGAPGDVYEQEADRVASQVMSMPDNSPQVQKYSEANDPHEIWKRAHSIKPVVQRVVDPRVEMGQMVQRAHQMGRNQASSLEANNPNEIWQRAQSIQPVVQRVVDPSVEMGQMVQRAHQMGRNQASGDLESRLNASKGGGSPLSENVRGFMEPRFGADFSGVRVHTGGEAVQMNQELGAQAFTHGSDVYFGEGKEPGNNELTAHELTHVVQQTGEETSTVQRHSLVSSKIPSSVNIARWAINGNTAKVNSENDRLGQLPGKFKSSASNWVCIKPLFMRTSSNPTPPTDFDTHYEKYLQLGDTFDISNLKKTYKGTSLKLSLFGDTENNNTVLSVLYPGIKTSQDPDQDIKATAQEGKTPIGDFVIGGHQSGGTMYGKSGEFNPGQFSPDEPAPTFSRAKDSKFPRRCWFTHFGTARSVGCSSESFGQSFASVYLRQGSGIDTTTRPIAPACTSDFKRPEGGCESIDAIEFRPANDEVKTSDHGPFKLSNSDAFHQSPFWSRIAGNL